jgi:ribosomal protein S18 acetylase RimI-like enzyme
MDTPGGAPDDVDSIVVRHRDPDDEEFIRATLTGSWGGSAIVVGGRGRDATRLPALVAELGGRRVGLLTYEPGAGHPSLAPLGAEAPWEVVSLDSLQRQQGVGNALLESVAGLAVEAGADSLWLVTTNDNVNALHFYQRRGFDLLALDRDAVTRAREMKRTIPEYGDGIAIRHELVLGRRLD